MPFVPLIVATAMMLPQSAVTHPGGGTVAPTPSHRVDVQMSFDGMQPAVEGIGRWGAAVVANEAAARAAADAERVRVAEATRTRPTGPPAARNVTAPAPVTHTGNGCGYADAIRATFGSAGDWAVSIAWRESNCQPGAKSSSGCWGLFQLCVPLHMDLFRSVCPDLAGEVGTDVALDPSCNIAAAWKLYQGAGSGPWRL